jgi:hypothetical protein
MNLICTYTDISWYLNLTFSHRIWNHTHICNNNLHLLYWCWISLDEIALQRWHFLHIYLDLKRIHWRWKLSSHCHETIAERYHWWGLVNRQAYKVGESLNQIQLCHLVQSMKLQLEHNKELLQFLNILCIMFKIIAFSIIKLLALLYVRVGILLTTANNCMTPSFH